MAQRTCSSDGCNRPHHAYDLCKRHYRQKRATLRVRRECDLSGCERVHEARGYCKLHYRRLRDEGTVGPVEPLYREDGTGYLRPDGYLVIKRHGHPLARSDGSIYAHRAVLYDAIGPGPHNCHWCGQATDWGSDGLTADHLDWDRRHNAPGNLVPSCLPCNSKRFATRSNRGEANPGSKLTVQQVAEIRAAVGLQRQIAERFGVSQSLVSQIRSGLVWSTMP